MIPSLLVRSLHVLILRTGMLPSAEAGPEPIKATKGTLFARIVTIFKLMLLFLSKVPSCLKGS